MLYAKVNRRRNPLKLVALLFLGIFLLFLPWMYIQSITSSRRTESRNSVPIRTTAVVFGAKVYANGQPSPFLRARVDAAVALYRMGKVQGILMTGDNSTSHYNEPVAMAKVAEAEGVPVSAITLDYAGFDTYQSCYRLSKVFNITNAVLITQSYHLPRAVFTCRDLGVEAVGLGVSSWHSDPGRTVEYTMREVLADWKAMWQVKITHPQ